MDSNFYNGPPITPPGTKQEPQAPGGVQNPLNTRTPGSNGNYYSGPPKILEEEKPPSPTPPAKKNGFLAKWASCLCGGGASS